MRFADLAEVPIIACPYCEMLPEALMLFGKAAYVRRDVALYESGWRFGTWLKGLAPSFLPLASIAIRCRLPDPAEVRG